MIEAITVGKLNGYIKQIFDAEEMLHNIPVIGEVFGVSFSRNVIYFSLKDDTAVLQCVCFYPNLASEIVEGDKIIATGSINFYVKGGRLNFNVIKVEKVGQGKLYEDFLKLKEKLQTEGLFDEKHKKPIPEKINRIGVISSREGAVIQDIRNVSWRRNPTVDIVLYNTKVQGINAENEIAHAIDVMGKYDNVDVIIVARGGGSLEDLWAYNTEIVARATYNCPKPIISAVGHETDFTIIDFVSDLRAPTPSAAAELVTFDLQEKKAQMWGLFDAFVKVGSTFFERKQNQTKMFAMKLLANGEKKLLNQHKLINLWKNKLISNYELLLNQKNYDLGIIENTLKKINPKTILNKGYAKLEQNGCGISSIDDIDMSTKIEISLHDGHLYAMPYKEQKNESK